MPTPSLKTPGKHNIQNSQVAYAIGQILKIPKDQISSSLQNFSGTWRRFEHKGKSKNGADVFDDYAHHPKEVQTTLEALKEEFGDKKRVVVFQPQIGRAHV